MAKIKTTVEVKMTQLEIFKELCEVLIDISKDDRIPMGVREVYIDRVNALIKKDRG